MANEQFTNTLTNLEAKTIDFVYRFGDSLRELRAVLGITRMTPVVEGYTIKTKVADATVALASGDVAEGALIPLSKVEFKEGSSHELKTNKWRKRTSYEAIQKYGFDNAVDRTDEEILKEIQKGIRTDLLSFNNQNAKTHTAVAHGLQGAIATSWGKLEELFEGEADRYIVFAHPMTIAEYIGNANIQMQTAFGVTYLEGFVNTTIIASNQIKVGEVVATVADNLNFFYIPASSEGGKAFNMFSDRTGLIGVTRSQEVNTLTLDTVFASGIKLIPEIENGIVKVKITKPAAA